jgi:hypothetical protein
MRLKLEGSMFEDEYVQGVIKGWNQKPRELRPEFDIVATRPVTHEEFQEITRLAVIYGLDAPNAMRVIQLEEGRLLGLEMQWVEA